MAKNENGYIAVDSAKVKRTKQEQMDRFDSFPPEVRAILRDAHFNVTVKDGSYFLKGGKGQVMKETLVRIARDSALKTYGSNYPLDTIK